MNSKIVLTGETHFITGVNDTKDEVIQMRNSLQELMKSSINGDIFLALEGVIIDDPVTLRKMLSGNDINAEGANLSHLNGIENLVPQDISVLGTKIYKAGRRVHLFFNISQNQQNFVQMFVEESLIFSYLEESKFLKDSFYAVKKKMEKSNSPLLQEMKRIEKYSYISPESFIQEIRTPSLQRADVHFKMLDALILILEEAASRVSSEDAKPIYNTPASLIPAVKDFKNYDFKAFTCKITLGWRNEIFNENIKALYCEAQAQGKDLVVRTGSLHVPGLAELLKKDLGENVNIQTPDLKNYSTSDKECIEMGRSY